MLKLSSTLTSGADPYDHLGKAIQNCKKLSDFDSDKIRGRAKYYGELDEQSLRHYIPRGPEKKMEMAHFVALLTDLPPRWIHDCATNRREFVKESCKDAK